MKYPLAVFLGLAGIVGLAQAQFDETFSYPNGPLSTAPGSPWQLWDSSSSIDMNVVGGVAVTTDGSDDIAMFASATLVNPGDVLSYRFDFSSGSSAGGGSSPNFTIVFAPATAPWGPASNENYNDAFGAVFNLAMQPGNQASVAALAGQGSGGLVSYSCGGISTGAFHHFTGTVVNLGGGLASDTMAMDGTTIFTSNFTLTDPRGIDAVEIYKSNTGSNNGKFDNIIVAATPVPEPATICALALGGLALIRRRR